MSSGNRLHGDALPAAAATPSMGVPLLPRYGHLF